MRVALLAALLPLAACAAVPRLHDAPVASSTEWRDVATSSDRARLRDWRTAFTRALDQARKAGHTLADELHLLTVHGVLHLLGYDHLEPADEREMFALQDKLLAQWRDGRARAQAQQAQRRTDDRLLGAAGLEDDSRP